MSYNRNLLVVLLCFFCVSTYSQDKHYFSLDTVLYSQMQDYRIEYNQAGLGRIQCDLPGFFEYYFSKGPYLPCFQMDFNFPSKAGSDIFDEQLVISEFSIDVQKDLVSEQIILDNEDDAIPVGSSVMENENITYGSNRYPWEQASTTLFKLLDTKQWCLRLLFFPFYYDAVNYNLFICKSCVLHIVIDTESTAIRDVNTLNSKRSALNNIFDLSGRRVSVSSASSASSVSSVLPKGVYIKDGQKVLVK